MKWNAVTISPHQLYRNTQSIVGGHKSLHSTVEAVCEDYFSTTITTKKFWDKTDLGLAKWYNHNICLYRACTAVYTAVTGAQGYNLVHMPMYTAHDC